MAESLPTIPDLRIGKCVGRGTYGDVFHGEINLQVIVKRFAHISEESVTNPNFARMVETMTNLRHPNLITCQSLNSKTVQLTTEKDFAGPSSFQQWDLTMERAQGSLEQVLKAMREAGAPGFNFPTIAAIFTSIVDCFVYLHNVAQITHGNFKFSNILICESKTFPLLDAPTSRFVAKVGDLVSHKIARVEERDPRQRGVAGWMNYMAPEITRGVNEGFAFDVYCFGNVLWQLLAFRKEFIPTFQGEAGSTLVPLAQPNVLREKQFVELNNLKLELALELDKLLLVDVISACWSYTPGLRPTFAGMSQWGRENLIPQAKQG